MENNIKNVENVIHSHNIICGGWTNYRTDISKEEEKIFYDALSTLKGVKYTPLAVATQVVSGLNYSFFCNAKSLAGGYNSGVTIHIFKSLSGDLRVVDINTLPR